MSTILLQRFANREYRLTNQSILSPQKQKGDKYKEKQAEKYAKAVHSTHVLSKSLEQGLVADYSNEDSRFSVFGEVEAREARRALDIIDEFHLVQKVVQKGGWGKLPKPTKFTKNARHRLLEAGAVIDKECGLNAWEVTVTLPGSGKANCDALCAYSGWIMNEITRELRKEKCLYWFYVWELQKRGALHLHLLLADKERDLHYLAQRIEQRWWVLLQSLSARLNQDLFKKLSRGTWRQKPWKWQSHVAKIRKSTAAYFSKYAGKGSNDIQSSAKFKTVGTPSRWWGSSRTVKKAITASRARWSWELSPSVSLEVELLLEDFLNQKHKLKSYRYDFDLGVTRNGTNLGGGRVSINYYNDKDFKAMQTWEEYYILAVADILRRHGYADMDTQTWSDADMACKPLLYADMEKHRETQTSGINVRRTPSPTPPNQQSSTSRKLSRARGTQPEATLALRARLIQFLGGGVGEVSSDRPDCTPIPEYIQGTLFNTNYYGSIDRNFLSYES